MLVGLPAMVLKRVIPLKALHGPDPNEVWNVSHHSLRIGRQIIPMWLIGELFQFCWFVCFYWRRRW